MSLNEEQKSEALKKIDSAINSANFFANGLNKSEQIELFEELKSTLSINHRSQDREKLVEDIEYIMLERKSSDLQYDVGDIAEDIVNHILTSLPTERANEVNEVKPPHNKEQPMSNENYDSNTPEEVIESWRISDEKFPRGLKEQPMSNENEELKPCPFCGSKVNIVEGKIFNWIECEKGSLCEGSELHTVISTDKKNNYDKAIKAWNTRPEDKRVEEALEMIDRLINVNEFNRVGMSIERSNLARDNVFELTKIRNTLAKDSTDDHY